MGEKDAVKQGVQFGAVQLQMLGRLVFVDMQVETWTPGAEVMGEKSQ